MSSSGCEKGRPVFVPQTFNLLSSSSTGLINSISAVTVTERRCGTLDDIQGCTLYKSMRRLKRHLIGGSNVDTPMLTHHRRREASLLVEVCTGGCARDGCMNGASWTRPFFWWTLVPFVGVWLAWIRIL